MTAVDARLAHLIQRARAADGHPPFSDGALAELALGARELVWVECADGEVVAAAIRTRSGGASEPAEAGHTGTPATEAPSTEAPATEAEFVVDPDARRHGHGAALLDRLIAEAPADLVVWAHGAHPGATHLAASRGLESVRELLHLRAAVPVAAAADGGAGAATADGGVTGAAADWVASAAAVSATVARGMFVSAAAASGAAAGGSPQSGHPLGPDWVDELLEVNARAFAEHPEQGRLTRAEFDVLAAEPWFDPSDVLLARDPAGGPTGRLAGFCWLKVEGDPAEGGLGEFYVVGVDPAQQGHGWGRRLVAAGLARLASRGIRTAHLYVEADNTPALSLYREFGFTEDSRDVQYRHRA